MLSLLALLWLPAVLLVALVTFCHPPRGKPRNLVPLLMAMGLEAALLLGAAWRISRLKYPIIDYSPDIGAEELPGTWESRVGTLALSADGTFQSSTGKHGGWSVATGARGLQMGNELWCVLRVDRQLQLLRPEDCMWDADNWYFSRAFKRKKQRTSPRVNSAQSPGVLQQRPARSREN